MSLPAIMARFKTAATQDAGAAPTPPRLFAHDPAAAGTRHDFLIPLSTPLPAPMLSVDRNNVPALSAPVQGPPAPSMTAAPAAAPSKLSAFDWQKHLPLILLVVLALLILSQTGRKRGEA